MSTRTGKSVTEDGSVSLSGYKGLLVIGDPMLGVSRRVGRADNTWDASFAKLEQSLLIAKDRELLPVIVGNLFHDTRNIGELLPIINLLSRYSAVLLPRNGRWQEQNQGHIAAILQATGISLVAGASASVFKLGIKKRGKATRYVEIDSYTSWGGKERLEPGAQGYLTIGEMNLTIMHGSALPLLEGSQEEGLRIVAGRLLRLSPVEESKPINVFSVTETGIEPIQLSVTPVVFTGASGTAEITQQELARESLFVEKLRETTGQALEEEGKESLADLIDQVCAEQKCDDWLKMQLLELSRQALG